MKMLFIPFIALIQLSTAHAVVFTVSSAHDEGLGTLRDAIEMANLNPGEDEIVFAINAGGPQSIELNSDFPIIKDDLIIDGSTQPGYDQLPIVNINWTGTIFSIQNANVHIQGLQIGQTSGIGLQAAILVNNTKPSNITIADNIIQNKNSALIINWAAYVTIEGNFFHNVGYNDQYAVELSNIVPTLAHLPKALDYYNNIFRDCGNGLKLSEVPNLKIGNGLDTEVNINILDSDGLNNCADTALTLVNLHHAEVSALHLAFDAPTETKGVGLNVQNCHHLDLEQIHVDNRSCGIWVHGGHNNSIRCSNITTNEVGVRAINNNLEVISSNLEGNEIAIQNQSMPVQINADGNYWGQQDIQGDNYMGNVYVHNFRPEKNNCAPGGLLASTDDFLLVEESAVQFQVYPNPVVDYVQLKFENLLDSELATVQILNMNGQVVYSTTTTIENEQALTINEVDHLTPGNYLVNLQLSNGQQVTQQLIKQ
ncbi:MAG: T9SS type A sorting domain-containing protein [Aureispira sp.]|nr:T9SS type A sorting domain-containing protein [Aureispira sp.]